MTDEPLPPTATPVVLMFFCASIAVHAYLTGHESLFAITIAGAVASAAIATYARVAIDQSAIRAVN